MLADRWRWLAGAIVVGILVVVAIRSGDHVDGAAAYSRVEVHSEAFLCVADAAVAEASSDGLQREPGPAIVQDPRCGQVATAGPGDVLLPRHTESDAAVGSASLMGELRFDEEQRCFYVVADGEPVGVVWPARFAGAVGPPRITDEDGSTVLATGDRFELEGRYVSDAGDDCGPVDVTSTGFFASSDVVPAAG